VSQEKYVLSNQAKSWMFNLKRATPNKRLKSAEKMDKCHKQAF
jgi:hypothetical protein